jgi:hypothetical protein
MDEGCEDPEIDCYLIKRSDLEALKFLKKDRIKPFFIGYLISFFGLIICTVIKAILEGKTVTLGNVVKDILLWDALLSLFFGYIGMAISFNSELKKFKIESNNNREKIKLDCLYSEVINLIHYCAPLKNHPVWDERKEKVKGLVNKAKKSVDSAIPSETEKINNLIKRVKFAKGQQSNIRAVWASTPASWEDSTTFYYILINGLVSLREFLSDHGCDELDFSGDTTDTKKFSKEETDILRGISNDMDVENFYSIRFLIFSEEEYERYADDIKSLIQIHQYFRMHCIPLVKEKLEKLETVMTVLAESEIQEFKSKFRLPLGQLIPDFFIIHNFTGFLPSEVDKPISELWVMDKKHISRNNEYYSCAEEIVKILASNFDKAIWDDYYIFEVFV